MEHIIAHLGMRKQSQSGLYGGLVVNLAQALAVSQGQDLQSRNLRRVFKNHSFQIFRVLQRVSANGGNGEFCAYPRFFRVGLHIRVNGGRDHRISNTRLAVDQSRFCCFLIAMVYKTLFIHIEQSGKAGKGRRRIVETARFHKKRLGPSNRKDNTCGIMPDEKSLYR